MDWGHGALRSSAGEHLLVDFWPMSELELEAENLRQRALQLKEHL